MTKTLFPIVLLLQMSALALAGDHVFPAKAAVRLLPTGLVPPAPGQKACAIGSHSSGPWIDASDPDAVYAIGCASLGKKEYADAIMNCTAALRLDPKHHNANDMLAWILATCPDEGLRDGQKAIQYASTACERTAWKDPGSLDTLAAAHAECGNFQEAIKWQQKALDAGMDESHAEGARQRLKLYEEGKPYRDE